MKSMKKYLLLSFCALLTCLLIAKSFVEVHADTEQIKEEVKLRGENYKVFVKKDGSAEVAYYDSNIHRLTENGFENIDNSLVKLNNKYITKKTNYKIEFPKYLSDKTEISLQHDNSLLSIRYLNASFSEAESIDIKSNNYLELSNLEGKIKYKDIYSKVDLICEYNNEEFNKKIILKEYVTDFSFNLIIKSRDLKLYKKDNKIAFVNEYGYNIFSINDYYLYDANNNVSTNKIDIDINSLSDNLHRINFKIDEQ